MNDNSSLLPADYVVCIYVRLSSEDDDLQNSGVKDESGSITLQRELIRNYLVSRREFSQVKIIERCDDGFSGTHFDTRPGFMEMIEMAKRGEINCIIVKDFSRFGRNYVELGDYLEQLFPFLGIRFISVNDGYDSAELKDGETGGLDVAFRNIFYDYYSRDLSKKERLAKRQLAERGEFSAAFAPYGYKKSESDKHKLEVDPERAKIVREIFDLRIGGAGASQIARSLNERGVESPAGRLLRKGKATSWEGKSEGMIWTARSIMNILQNEEYTGTLVAQKAAVREIGGKQRKASEEHCVKVKDTHEAIISREVFDKVQSMIKPMPKREQKNINVFRCGYCGRKMTNRRKTGSMTCITGRLSPSAMCKKAKTLNAAADAAVLETIKQRLQVFLDEEEKRLKGDSCDLKSDADEDNAEILVSSLKREKQAWMKMYDDYSDGAISKEDFLEFKKRYDQQTAELEQKIEESRMRAKAHEAKASPETLEKYREIMKATELTQEIQRAFVDSVDLYEDRMEIHLKTEPEI